MNFRRLGPWSLVLLLSVVDVVLLLHIRGLRTGYEELPAFMLEQLDPALVERLAVGAGSSPPPPPPDLRLIDRFVTPEGATFRLDESAVGLVLLVFIGAYDCSSCLAELGRWQERGEPYSGDALKVVLVGSDRDRVEIEAFLAIEGIDFPLLVDRDNRVRDELGILSGPEKLLFDAKNGSLLWRKGPGTSDAEHDEVDRILRMWARVVSSNEEREH